MIDQYVIVRTYSAGVFAGFLEALEGKQEVDRIIVTEVIEILSVTEIAKDSIAEVAVWKI